jgi:hypothetical protein
MYHDYGERGKREESERSGPSQKAGGAKIIKSFLFILKVFLCFDKVWECRFGLDEKLEMLSTVIF